MSRSFPQSFKGDESPSPTSARVPRLPAEGLQVPPLVRLAPVLADASTLPSPCW